MIYNSDKTIIIQDLQCRLTSWLDSFNKNLSLNTCVDNSNSVNIQVTNFINVLYRYKSFDDTVTNSQKIEFTYNTLQENESVTIEIYEGLNLLATYSGQDNLNTILINLSNQINTDVINNYNCIIQENCLYLYTYDVGQSYSNVITTIIVETDVSEINISAVVTPIITEDLDIILNTFNCLTLDDTCKIIKKIKELLKNCNCN